MGHSGSGEVRTGPAPPGYSWSVQCWTGECSLWDPGFGGRSRWAGQAAGVEVSNGLGWGLGGTAWTGCLRFQDLSPNCCSISGRRKGWGRSRAASRASCRTFLAPVHSTSLETFCGTWTPGIWSIARPPGDKGFGRSEKCSRGHRAWQEEALQAPAPSLTLHPLFSLPRT